MRVIYLKKDRYVVEISRQEYDLLKSNVPETWEDDFRRSVIDLNLSTRVKNLLLRNIRFAENQGYSIDAFTDSEGRFIPFIVWCKLPDIYKRIHRLRGVGMKTADSIWQEFKERTDAVGI